MSTLSIHEIRVRSPFGSLKVRVTGSAISTLRSRGSRSLPAFVIAEQRELIERIAVCKFEAGTLDTDGFVVVGEEDVLD